MPKRTKRVPLPFEEQKSFLSAVILVGVTAPQLEKLYMDLFGWEWTRARLVPFIANRYGVSCQPVDGGRVVVLVNPVNGYDVAIDAF